MERKLPSIRQGGAYIIKAAESRPRPVASKSGGTSAAPTIRDRSVVDALIKLKQPDLGLERPGRRRTGR